MENFVLAYTKVHHAGRGGRKIMNKTAFVSELPETVQGKIYIDLITKARLVDMEEINMAMNSRLCDLEDTINIKPYL